jgi:hemin uptake protein HemP
MTDTSPLSMSSKTENRMPESSGTGEALAQAPVSGAALPMPSAALAVSSAALLRGRKTVAITHNGMLYMLQATKLGKLILTK